MFPLVLSFFGNEKNYFCSAARGDIFIPGEVILTKLERSLCYTCEYRRMLPDDRAQCINTKANVKGHEGAIMRGLFIWPLSFDPNYLLECDGHKEKPGLELKDIKVR